MAKSALGMSGCLVGGLVGSLLFVPLWAGLNFAFGTALDGPIGAFVMEAPCQRLADTSEPLIRYSLGRGRRPSNSVCHFATGPVYVVGRTEGLGFTGREFVYLMIGFAGYAVCFTGAMGLAFLAARGSGRLFARAVGNRRNEQPSSASSEERGRHEP